MTTDTIAMCLSAAVLLGSTVWFARLVKRLERQPLKRPDPPPATPAPEPDWTTWISSQNQAFNLPCVLVMRGDFRC